MNLPVDSIRAGLAQLRQADPSGRFELHPPISPQDLTQFETKHRIVLPDDYRSFLLSVSNGGPGPSEYGLLPLVDTIQERGPSIYGLDEPFPAPASTADLVMFAAAGILPIGYEGCAYYHGLVISGPDRGQVWNYVEARPGWIPVASDQICTADGRRFHEQMWRDSDYCDAYYDTVLLPRNIPCRQSFAQWYLRWLEDAQRYQSVDQEDEG